MSVSALMMCVPAIIVAVILMYLFIMALADGYTIHCETKGRAFKSFLIPLFFLIGADFIFDCISTLVELITAIYKAF